MLKANTADIDAAELLKLQKSVCDDTTRRSAHFALTVSLALFIFLCAIFIWIIPQKEFSENENRLLADIPSLNIRNILDGKFTVQISDFYSDHFPLRDGLVSIASYTELILGRREANNVVVGPDGILAERRGETITDRRNLESNYNAIAELSRRLGLPYTVAIIPSALTAQDDILKTGASAGRIISCKNFIYLDDRAPFQYYKTDHHRTTEGSYAAYSALGEFMGYSPYPADKFSRETVSSSFYGTAWSRSGLYLTSPDTIELWRYDDDSHYTISGDLSQSGFYDYSKLTEKDKYAVFLGGNHGVLNISNGDQKPHLLLIKDSFANSVIPFLARHFDLTVVDPRYFHGDLISLAEDCSNVLFLYGINSLITDRDLLRLTLE